MVKREHKAGASVCVCAEAGANVCVAKTHSHTSQTWLEAPQGPGSPIPWSPTKHQAQGQGLCCPDQGKALPIPKASSSPLQRTSGPG